MWVLIDSKLIGRKQQDLSSDIKAQIFSESMKLYMTNIINEKRGNVPSSKEKPIDDEHCRKCGRKFTEREMGFLDGKTGDARICYHCSH